MYFSHFFVVLFCFHIALSLYSLIHIFHCLLLPLFPIFSSLRCMLHPLPPPTEGTRVMAEIYNPVYRILTLRNKYCYYILYLTVLGRSHRRIWRPPVHRAGAPGAGRTNSERNASGKRNGRAAGKVESHGKVYTKFLPHDISLTKSKRQCRSWIFSSNELHS